MVGAWPGNNTEAEAQCVGRRCRNVSSGLIEPLTDSPLIRNRRERKVTPQSGIFHRTAGPAPLVDAMKREKGQEDYCRRKRNL